MNYGNSYAFSQYQADWRVRLLPNRLARPNSTSPAEPRPHVGHDGVLLAGQYRRLERPTTKTTRPIRTAMITRSTQ